MDPTTPDHWKLTKEGLQRDYRFADFREALTFVVKMGQLAEEAQHHPDISIEWNKVKLNLITHSQSAVTQNDFDMASKINEVSLDSIEEEKHLLFAP